MNGLKSFFEKIIRRDTAESSKRLVALVVLMLIVFIVMFYTEKENFLSVLNSLLFFVSALLGISSIETAFMYKKGEKQVIDEKQNS